MIKPYIPRIMPGQEPGTAFKPKPDAHETEVEVFIYNASEVQSYTIQDLFDHKIAPSADHVLWVRITGIKDTLLIQKISQFFSFHPLAIEDAINTYQRAKVDDFTDYQFIVSKLIELQDEEMKAQQLSMFLGHNYVVSLLEKPSPINDYFDRNMHNTQARLRSRGCDYLVYELLDYTIDSAFPVMAVNSDKLDTYENEIMQDPTDILIRKVQVFKRDLRYLRQIFWSNRDMLAALMRNELDLVSDSTEPFIRDCYDHAVRQMDVLESQRESAVSLIDIYLSSMANRLGQVMKILTGISIIFMPPTFLAGVWGMNFRYMPELSWPHGYLFAWVAFIISSILPSIYFWRKGWLNTE